MNYIKKYIKKYWRIATDIIVLIGLIITIVTLSINYLNERDSADNWRKEYRSANNYIKDLEKDILDYTQFFEELESNTKDMCYLVAGVEGEYVMKAYCDGFMEY